MLLHSNPLRSFTGKATPVRVQIADINGTTVTTNYTPTVVAEDGTVIVEYKDEEGNVISPSTTPVNKRKSVRLRSQLNQKKFLVTLLLKWQQQWYG